jgi:hypothetical protein
MPVANFEELCKGFCAMAGCSVPDLSPDPNGEVAVEMEMSDVNVILAHGAATGPNRAVVTAVFGPLPQENELEACRVLMDLNMGLLTAGAVYGRDPVSGEVVLQDDVNFEDSSVLDVYQRVSRMIEAASNWRQHHFLPQR